MVLILSICFSAKPTGASVSTMYDSNDCHINDVHDIPDGKNVEKRRKHERQHGCEIGGRFEDKFNSSVSIKKFYTETSRHTEASALDYSEGWQDRRLEKAREMKTKQSERKRKVLQKRLVDKQTLEEKRCLVELYGSTGTSTNKTNKTERINLDNGSWLMDNGHELLHSDVSKRNGSYRIDIDKDDTNNTDTTGYQPIRSDGKELKRVRSSYENFKNNPVIIQPYRLEKFNSTKDEIFLEGLNLDINTTELPDRLLELIPRPKSAPSIPSKCRKYVLVSNDSENTHDIPEPTALEEMLMFQRFPKSDLGKLRSRSSSPRLVSEIRRSYSLQKVQNVNMSCK